MPVARQNGINLTVKNFPGNAESGEDAAESFRQTAKYVIRAHFKDGDIVDHETAGYRLMRDGRWYRPALIGEGKTTRHHA